MLTPSLPPSRGDIEVIPSGLPSPVAPFTSGVESNHSSSELSVNPNQSIQWNDDELGNPSQGYLDPAGEDPNMSGPSPTEGVEERLAGGMSGPYGGMQAMDCADDYLQWLPVGGSAEAFGGDSTSPQGDFGSSNSTVAGIVVFPIVRRS